MRGVKFSPLLEMGSVAEWPRVGSIALAELIGFFRVEFYFFRPGILAAKAVMRAIAIRPKLGLHASACPY